MSLKIAAQHFQGGNVASLRTSLIYVKVALVDWGVIVSPMSWQGR